MTNEELVMRIKAGIDTADNMLQLWEKNKRFIHFMALKYKGMAELEDLEQEGYLALNDAVERYAPAQSVSFINYAAMQMRQKMHRYIQNNGTVRIPVYERTRMAKYHKIVNRYKMNHGRKPTRNEIAHDLGISNKDVFELERSVKISRIGSLDSPLQENEDDTIGDMVAGNVDIEGEVLEKMKQEQLCNVLWSLVDSLPDQQGCVIRKRFQEGRTLKYTGESLGVSTEQARQLEAKAMRRLRCSQNTRLLRPFLDETIFSMGVKGNSVALFNTTRTSSTERAAMKIYEGVRCAE